MLEHRVVDTRRGAQVGEVQRRVARVLLHPGDLQLERGPAVGRGGLQQVAHTAGEHSGEVVQGRQPRLTMAVLQLGQVGGGAAEPLAELIQGEARPAAEVADPPPDDQRVDAGVTGDCEV